MNRQVRERIITDEVRKLERRQAIERAARRAAEEHTSNPNAERRSEPARKRR